MGDVRYSRHYASLRGAADPPAAIRGMRHDELVGALAAAAADGNAYLTNVLASEAENRLRGTSGTGHAEHADSVRAARGIGPGEHACLVYATREEQLRTAVPYIQSGLERGEKCLYVGADHEVGELADHLRTAGVPVDDAVAEERLVILTHREAYLKNGRFDPDWMIGFLKESTEAALAAGFEALRIAGDMAWALGHDVGGERILEYEAKLNTFFETHPASAICQYDRTRFRPDVVVDVVHTHPRVIYGGVVSDNPYYVPPAEFLSPTDPRKHLDRLLDNIVARAHAESALLELNESLGRRVAQRTAALSDANRELEAYLHTLSHDLRAPLRGLEQYARALEEDAGDRLDPDSRAHLARLRAESTRLTRLVADLAMLSRAAGGDLVREDVDLTDLARVIEKELTTRDSGHAVRLVVHDGMRVDGDPRLLRTVLENLLGNAWKFTSRTPAPEVTFGTEPADEGPVFFVRDNGAGFDPSQSDRLFRLFERLHSADEFSGTGVGLASVQRIVRRHGGRVWAEGAPDRGATFYFTL